MNTTEQQNNELRFTSLLEARPVVTPELGSAVRSFELREVNAQLRAYRSLLIKITK